MDEVAEVVTKYQAANLPLEAMWTDIDYMDGYRDFSLDPNNFSKDKMQVSRNQWRSQWRRVLSLHGMALYFCYSLACSVAGIQQLFINASEAACDALLCDRLAASLRSIAVQQPIPSTLITPR